MKEIELFIEENWGISEVEIDKTLQDGGEKKVFLVQAVEGPFVVKIFNRELTEEQIFRYTNVLVFLANNPNCNAPKLIKLKSGKLYTRYYGRYIYMLEYIEGTALTESMLDEYTLGQALARLHGIDGYVFDACIDINKSIKDMLNRFQEYPFKKEYDEIVRGLPDFNKTKKCFIHTDVCPKNALKNQKGEVVFIDFDDAGNGPLFTDLGYPLITQFVQFVGREEGKPIPDPEKLFFKYDEAKSFYNGYFSVTKMTNSEKELIFHGAVYMQLVYMPVFGEDAVPFLWKILKYAIDNKNLLMGALGINS